MRLRFLAFWMAGLGTVLLAGCGAPDVPPPSSAGPAPAAASQAAPVDTPSPPADSAATFEATGVVRSVTPSGSHMVIRHDAIPGFMDAMTMAFAVAAPSVVEGVQRNDAIRFRFVVGTQGVVVQHVEPASAE